MFKPRHIIKFLVGQRLLNGDLSTVFGGQSREADDVSKQTKQTVDEVIDYVAPWWRPLDATIRLAGLTERLVQRSLDHDVRWTTTDQQATQEMVAKLEAAQHQQDQQEADQDQLLSGDVAHPSAAEVAAWAASSAASSAAAYSADNKNRASAAGSHPPSPHPNTPSSGPGSHLSDGAPYR